jgi:hypothetical protein
MSDAHPSPDFLGSDADEELVFDEAETIEPPITAENVAQPRRGLRLGRKSIEDGASAAVPLEDREQHSSAEVAPAASAEEPAGAPAPFPPQGVEPAGSKSNRLLLAIVTLALLTCLFSLGGLIAVGRTLARAGIDRREALAERAAMERVPALVAHLDEASARLDMVSARLTAASPSGAPATVADVRRELDSLKLALAQRQPQGLDTLNGMTRDGFSEMATKLDRLSARLDGARRGGSMDDDDTVSANRPASRAAYPRRPS